MGKTVAKEILPFIKVYTDGSVERLLNTTYVPPSPSGDPETGVSSKDIIISQIPLISARLYVPKLAGHTEKLPVLVYAHGGGFCGESAFSSAYQKYLNNIVSQAEVVAVSVEYRLAPEHPLPIAYQDCWAVLNWVASHKTDDNINNVKKDPWLLKYGDFDRLYVGGDSAGGNIAHNIVMQAGAEGLKCDVKILGALLVHPYFCGSKPIGSESNVESKKSLLSLESAGSEFEKSLIYVLWDFVYPSAPDGIDNVMVNPVGPGKPSLAKLGCSRLLVCVAEKDVLFDRGVWYVNEVKKSGFLGEVELYQVEGEDHCFLIFNPDTEKAKDMFKRLASFLK